MSYIGNTTSAASYAIDTFSGDGSTVNFTLRDAPVSTSAILVFVGGVRQELNTYSLSSTTLTFTGAPPSGTLNIQVVFSGAGTSVAVPSDGSVTTAKMASNITLTGNTTTSNLIVTGNVTGNLTVTGNTTTSNLTVTGNTTTGNLKATGTIVSNVAGVGQFSSESIMGFKNRIINGAMVIDQRNAGATSTANGVYTVDRWGFGAGVAGKMTWGQNYNSLTPPAGFTNYFGFKTTTAYTVGASEFFLFYQSIEGYNTADLDFGKASAKTITFSFWVNSTLTGTFGGVLYNSAQNRSYPFTYTISVASTWEQKTITVVGDTTGTWLTTNGNGLTLTFGLGVGSTYNGTATGAWQAATYLGATGATSVVATLNATWNITGVQLEKGSTATSFDYRPYGTELALCQRYYHKTYPQTTAPADSASGAADGIGAATVADANSIFTPSIPYPVCMRASPTFTFYRTPNSTTSGMGAAYNGVWQTGTSTALRAVSDNRFSMYITKTATFTAGYSYLLEYAYSATAEL